MYVIIVYMHLLSTNYIHITTNKLSILVYNIIIVSYQE